MQCNSPRANAGFSMLPASIAPSPLPAPTMVCSSSINRIVWPSVCASSLITDFNRSSNSPRYLAPAIKAPISSDNTRLFFKPSGTSPFTIRCAKPSAIAVLPTPGSPINTGLFLVRRCNTWITRRISSSRPITGSSLPTSARSVRSKVYLANASRCSSAPWSFTLSPPRITSIASSTSLRDPPALRNNCPKRPLSSTAARTNISEAINLSLRFWANLSHKFNSIFKADDNWRSPWVPCTCGKRSNSSANCQRNALASIAAAVSNGRIELWSWFNNAVIK